MPRWPVAGPSGYWLLASNPSTKVCKTAILLLWLALQPTVGFSLLSDSLPFCSFFTLISPPSYSHYLHIFFDVCNPPLPLSIPIRFHSHILLGVLLSSIRITWPSQAILLLFINLNIYAFSISSFSSWLIQQYTHTHTHTHSHTDTHSKTKHIM